MNSLSFLKLLHRKGNLTQLELSRIWFFRLEEFKAEQELENHNVVAKLKTGWVPNIEKIITTEFSGSEKAWLNLKETNKVLNKIASNPN